MTRYTVWACFGVDADSPEQAKVTIKRFLYSHARDDYREELYADHRINAVVCLSPELDKMLDEIEEE